MKKNLFLVLLTMLTISSMFAQSTYLDIKATLSANCAGSGCHGGALPGFNVNASDADFYDAIFNVAPLNPTAAGKSDKLIDPGYPKSSFLLRKVANCLSGDLALYSGEGESMPKGRPALSEVDVELIRQWVIYGAPETGNVVNKAYIEDFYAGRAVPRIAKPAAPDSCEGFQVHMGPIFFGAREEKEYFLKHDLRLPEGVEVTRLDVKMSYESHHFILRKFRPGTKQNWPEGLELLNPLTAFDSDKDYVMAWQDDLDVTLPGGTAYSWDSETALDLNFHMFNYHDSVLVGDIYINVYYQAEGTADKIMKSSLINNAALFIQPSPNEVTISDNDNMSNVSVWSLTSHTHKYGTDYDIWLKDKNTNGKGPQVFEGMEKDGVNFGFYDWEHPPTKYFEPFLFVDPTLYNGFIHEAKYKNTGSNFVTFGFTTADEMMIYYVQYLDGDYQAPTNWNYTAPCSKLVTSPCDTLSTGLRDYGLAKDVNLNVFPNPFQNKTEIKYTIKEQSFVNLEVFDIMGRKVKTFANTTFKPGTYSFNFEGEKNNSDAVYFIKLTIDGKSAVSKLVQF